MHQKKNLLKTVKTPNNLPNGYEKTLIKIKDRIRRAQIKASLKVNEELIKLYWDIGRTIVEKQQKEGWGAKVVEKMSIDLRSSFPRMGGLSPRNLLYMKQFAEAYIDLEITQQVAAKIPWGHNMILLDKLKNRDERIWYAKKTLENGWSRDVL